MYVLQALRHPWLSELESESDTASSPSSGESEGDDARGSGAAGRAASPFLDSVVQRLQRFGTYGRLKQIALRRVANAAMTVAGDSAMLAEIRAAFEAMDTAGDGRVPYGAVVAFLADAGFDLSETETEVRTRERTQERLRDRRPRYGTVPHERTQERRRPSRVLPRPAAYGSDGRSKPFRRRHATGMRTLVSAGAAHLQNPMQSLRRM